MSEYIRNKIVYKNEVRPSEPKTSGQAICTSLTSIRAGDSHKIWQWLHDQLLIKPNSCFEISSKFLKTKRLSEPIYSSQAICTSLTWRGASDSKWRQKIRDDKRTDWLNDWMTDKYAPVRRTNKIWLGHICTSLWRQEELVIHRIDTRGRQQNF